MAMTRHRWEARYSSSEMMILAIEGGEVRLWLHHSPASAERHAFDAVLGGVIDADVRNIFGQNVLDELKAAIRDCIANPPQPFDKKADMLRRRREG